jgi:hypothetical protein
VGMFQKVIGTDVGEGRYSGKRRMEDPSCVQSFMAIPI